MYNIKERLKKLGLTQAWLILELRKRNIAVVQAPELSQYINGVSTYPKSVRVLEACDKILKELENEHAAD